MFNLQGSELVIILLLALVVLGPEKLPDAMRKAGQFYAELKKMSSGFQSEFKAAIEEPLSELKDTANTLRDSADFTKLQNGERTEKPKSAEMVAAADPDAVPVDDLPFTPEMGAAGAIVESQLVESDPIATDATDAADAAAPSTESVPAPPEPLPSSQHLSSSPPSPPAADRTAASDRPSPDSSQGDDPGNGPDDVEVDDEPGEPSE